MNHKIIQTDDRIEAYRQTVFCESCGKHRDIIDKYGCMGSPNPCTRPAGCLLSSHNNKPITGDRLEVIDNEC